MYAQTATAMNQQQQQAVKQQGQHYNQNNSTSGMGGAEDYYGRGASNSSAKDGKHMYAVASGQGQQGSNKHGQRANNTAYTNQGNQARSFQ
jgi:hypothetical protein